MSKRKRPQHRHQPKPPHSNGNGSAPRRFNGGVVLAWASPTDKIDPAFMDCVLKLKDYDRANEDRMGLRGGWVHLFSGPRIASARNTLVQSFLNHQSKAEIMLCLDTDVIFQPEDAYDLIRRVSEEHPIVSGLYFAGVKGGGIRPLLYGADPNNPGVLYEVEDYPENALVKCAGVGAGFLAIHRTALEKIWHKYKDHAHVWFAEAEATGDSRHEWGEDLVFCLRAQDVGLPIMCDTGITVGHRKPAVLTVEDYRAYQALEPDAKAAVLKTHLQDLGAMAR